MTIIARATPKDIPDLLAMMRRLCAFHGDCCVLGLADAQQYLINDKRLITLMARCDGRAVGYAVIEPKWNPTVHAQPFDIAHLYVVEHMRARAVGRQLIAAACTIAYEKGAGRLTIGTSLKNPGAAAAYRAMGLTEIDTMPGPRFDVQLQPQRKMGFNPSA